MAAAKEYRIEVVRGRISGPRSASVLAFWAEHDALTEEAARRRLPQVVSLLLDEGDRVAGVNSVCPERVPLIGDRLLWIYRAFLAPEVPPKHHREMTEAAHGALAGEFQGEGDEPIGVCLLAAEESVPRDTETLWPGSGMLHAGYLPDGRQVRVGYFEGARI